MVRIRPKTERNRKILAYVAKGMTYQDIANMTHMTKGNVARIVKRWGQVKPPNNAKE